MDCPLCHHTIPEPTHRNALSVGSSMDRDLEVEVTIYAFGGSVSAYIDKMKAQEVIAALKNAFAI